MGVEVRRREDADLPELAEALVRVYAQDGYPVEGVANPRAWLAPPREVAAWTALYEGQRVGHISLTQADLADDAAKVWHQYTGQSIEHLVIPVRLFVDPAHRKRGAGALLMIAVRDYAASHDRALAFDVMLKDDVAIRLYEAAGCIRIGTITHVHSDGETEPAAVYMVPTDTNQ